MAFKSLTNKEARAEYNRLQKAEKLYLKAVEGAGWKYVKGEIEKVIGENLFSEKITAEMSDEGRYKVLKDRSISLTAHTDLEKLTDVQKKLKITEEDLDNRNAEGYKVDDALKNVYVLASAFVDGESIIPVKLEVKEFLDKKILSMSQSRWRA